MKNDTTRQYTWAVTYSLRCDVSGSFRRVQILLCVLMVVANYCGWAETPPPLTFEETIGLALQGNRWSEIGRLGSSDLDQSAAPVLLEALQGDAQAKAVSSLVAVVGFIGETTEYVDIVEARMLEAAELLTRAWHDDEVKYPERQYATLTFYEGIGSLARLVSRDTPGAAETWRRMSAVEYWISRSIVIPTHVEDLPYDGLFAVHAISLDLYPKQQREAANTLAEELRRSGISVSTKQYQDLEKIAGMSYRHSYLWPRIAIDTRLSDASFRQRLRNRGLEYLGITQELEQSSESVITPAWSQRAEQVPLLLSLDELGLEFYDLQNIEDEERQAQLNEIRESGLEAWSQYVRLLHQRNYVQFLRHALQGGNTISTEQVRFWEQHPDSETFKWIRSFLDKQLDVVTQLPSDPSMSDAEIAIQNESDLFVVIPIKDAAATAQLILPPPAPFKVHSHFTYAENGDLLIVMRKIEDKWYWNPFGW